MYTVVGKGNGTDAAWSVLWCLVTFLMVMLGRVTGSAAGSEALSTVKLQPIDVSRGSNIQYYAGAALGVLTFKVPAEMGPAGDGIARIYVQELLKPGLFRDVKFLAHSVVSQQEAVWLARTHECDLIMEATVQYLLDGSGAMPTRLEVAVKILDARSEKVSWDLRQKASSSPGKDLDLFWTVRRGAPAQRYPAMAKSLAVQLTNFLSALLAEVGTEEKGGDRGRASGVFNGSCGH